MFRKILSAVFALFMFVPFAHSAEMVNVEYVHKVLLNRWGIDLPYNPALKNPQVAANMKYLLTVVDIANAYLNGKKTTDYGNSEYATLAAADTIATNTAMDNLIRGQPFYITTTPDTTQFSIRINPAGNFRIDWGDGEVERIIGKNVGNVTYSHTYDAAGEYTIELSGRATRFDSGFYNATLYFPQSAQYISKISGNLGRIFTAVGNDLNQTPTFRELFNNATNLTEIPSGLFDGVTRGKMLQFYRTFANSGVTTIPADLFANVSGLQGSQFYETFKNSKLTSIPETLFAGKKLNSSASDAFYSTFEGTPITEIPANLFADVSGNPERISNLFNATFKNTKITSIPENLFAGITGNTGYACFQNTFAGTPITEIPANLFAGITGLAGTMDFAFTFYNCKSLQSVPAGLFAGIQGAPSKSAFYRTFRECTELTTIPDGLFAGISGAPAVSMFDGTFAGCSKLQSIPENLFGDISGPAAQSMFTETFLDCTSLTGPSARIGGKYLYEIWETGGPRAYQGAVGLSDYGQIPENWKSNAIE